VAIYLDANVFYSWKTFAELDRVAVTIVGQQTKQVVVIPEVAAWEAEAHYRRTLERAARDLRKAHRAALDAFRGADLAPLDDFAFDARVEHWRQELERFAEVLALHPDDAREAHRREAFGIPPGKRVLDERGKDIGGKGGRDTAIWLSVVRDHLARDEEGHFISENTSDFGVTAELKPALAADVPSGSAPLNNYGSLDDFLALLGEPRRDFHVPVEEVARRLPSVLRVVLPATTHVPRAVFGTEYDWQAFHYCTEVKDARPIRVLASRRYEQDQEAITVINVQWEIVVDCFRLPSEDDVGTVVGYEGVLLTGGIQAYLPDDDEQLAQMISARLEAASLPPMTRAVGG
jgi:hypothetical protein